MAQLELDLSAQTRAVPVRTDADKQRHRDKSASLLKLLLAHPNRWWTTAELVQHIGHRFSTNVQSLRDRGYMIQKRPAKRGFEYRYLYRVDVIPATADGQQRYYGSQHWQERRRARMEHDGNRCVNCHATDDLDVHHWRYDLFEERLGDLMTLCGDCHRRLHALDGVTITFPKNFTAAQAKRLGIET